MGLAIGPSRLPALHCGDFCPRGRTSGHCAEDSSPSLAGGFRLPSRVPVQPSKAAPRSRGGRLPEASRGCACEAHPQAPHPIPPSRRLMTAPLCEPSAPKIRPVREGGDNFFFDRQDFVFPLIPAPAGIQEEKIWIPALAEHDKVGLAGLYGHPSRRRIAAKCTQAAPADGASSG